MGWCRGSDGVDGDQQRQDWWNKIPVIALLGGLGWAAGGMMSYGLVVGYGRGSDFINVMYGLTMLAVIGGLYGFIGGGFLGLELESTREKNPAWATLLTENDRRRAFILVCAGGATGMENDAARSDYGRPAWALRRRWHGTFIATVFATPCEWPAIRLWAPALALLLKFSANHGQSHRPRFQLVERNGVHSRFLRRMGNGVCCGHPFLAESRPLSRLTHLLALLVLFILVPVII